MTINDNKPNKSTTSVIEEMARKEMKDDTKTWLAAHLFYAEPWEEFLIDAVKPFVQSILADKFAEQFFFIRYWERGPHIRLRFYGETKILNSKLKPAIAACFSDYFRKQPSRREEPDWIKKLPREQRWFSNNSVQFIPYEPEIERYGGPVGLQIAEKQFEASSRAVLDILKENKPWSYDRALGAAIQLHLAFASGLHMDLTESKAFYSHVFQNWLARSYSYHSKMNEVELKSKRDTTLKAFEENFVTQQPTLVPYIKTVWQALEHHVAFQQTWLNRWRNKTSTVYDQLCNSQNQQKLTYPDWLEPNRELKGLKKEPKLWFILGSCIHMTNNRLGILNRDEAYLGYLIKSCLESI